MYIITGVSRGLGKAIAEQYLGLGHTVIGIGRTNVIEHDDYTFIPCDFYELHQVKELFKSDKFNSPVTLINNAGVLGRINRISDQQSLDVKEVMDVNVVAPMMLTKSVYAAMRDPNDFTLVNISSGAANKAIPSWASYCASKAALNMLTETFYLEEKEKGRTIKAYTIAPGVIDTRMQEQIRKAPEDEFSSVQRFIEMKKANTLTSPSEAARRLVALLSLPYNDQVFFDLRDVNP